ncbi:GntR family transcriptional regulator [Ahrensia sp. R2A130]|uniref:GntR family transcriptional regulator n=1 Tax=Ahrensia sp. R2A130 TaxID=744979 RepID=UPI0001E0BCDE|nr:FCD domain-containing protein [Ahrensia sp. R2A130]EFL87722.1 regulatory protein [Ahrensia sp. R2A130]
MERVIEAEQADFASEGISLGNASAGSPSMTSRAYAALKQDIISGALHPGAKLKIEQLRERYDVGTSPIREALSLLTSDHFVERIDQRGFRVSKASTAEFAELLKTRCWLEERALRESIANGSQAWEEQVVLANYRLSRIPRSQAADHFVANAEWEAAHKLFHMTLIAECGSTMLLKFCDQLYDQNVRYRQLSGTQAYPNRDVAEEHSAICDAVLARDADLASQRLMEHYQQTSIYLADSL